MKTPPTNRFLRWFSERVAAEDVQRANAWLVSERRENLDRQDAEETVPVTHG